MTRKVSSATRIVLPLHSARGGEWIDEGRYIQFVPDESRRRGYIIVTSEDAKAPTFGWSRSPARRETRDIVSFCKRVLEVYGYRVERP